MEFDVVWNTTFVERNLQAPRLDIGGVGCVMSGAGGVESEDGTVNTSLYPCIG